jgi:epoxyqueuosine reductase
MADGSGNAEARRARMTMFPPVRDENFPPKIWIRRAREEVILWLTPRVRPITRSLVSALAGVGGPKWLRFVPRVPRALERVDRPSPWNVYTRTPPPTLRGVAGIRRNPAAEEKAFAEFPLHDYNRLHWEAVEFFYDRTWSFLAPLVPRLLRAANAVRRANAFSAVGRPKVTDPEEVTRLIREYAAAAGLSAVGFAEYDPKYTFAEYTEHRDAYVIVAVVEQDWAATQTAPSDRSERAHFGAYAELLPRVAKVAEFIKTLGHPAHAQFAEGEGVLIHYAVQAGLGQLGLNGQLLTPQAGSRCRLAAITTGAPLVPDQPVDYGIERICDECQLCVKRCPVGAIPNQRREFRGVVKAKIKSERCFPVVAQMHGCAICMKVCPVQRHGLEAVTDHFVQTGTILGKGTDELEGYVWPADGRFYGPGQKPRFTPELINPPGWFMDPSRKTPVIASTHLLDPLADEGDGLVVPATTPGEETSIQTRG